MTQVLVVDDEPGMRETFSIVLDHAGYQVNTAEDAIKALQALGEYDTDVVVTDIIMPKLSGVALLQAIRERSPRVKVIMLTGEPSLETAAASIRAGAFDYLSKPVEPETLLRVVERAAREKALEDDTRHLQREKENYRTNLEALLKERTRMVETQQERLRLLFAEAKEAILLVDPDDGRILECNRAVTTMLRREETDLEGMKVEGLFPEPADFRDLGSRVLRTGATFSNTMGVLNGFGERLPIELTVSLLEIQDRPRWMLTLRDQRERKLIKQLIDYLVEETNHRYQLLIPSLEKLAEEIPSPSDRRQLEMAVSQLLLNARAIRRVYAMLDDIPPDSDRVDLVEVVRQSVDRVRSATDRDVRVDLRMMDMIPRVEVDEFINDVLDMLVQRLVRDAEEPMLEIALSLDPDVVILQLQSGPGGEEALDDGVLDSRLLLARSLLRRYGAEMMVHGQPGSPGSFRLRIPAPDQRPNRG